MPILSWIGKQAVEKHHLEIPYRLLEYDESLSVGDKESGNLIVQGDNLHALKSLLPYYAGKVKCVYIDPPYNTGNEGWKYSDNVNSPEIRAWLNKAVGSESEDLSRHDKWLCMMYPRLQLLKKFLSKDGVFLISIGDDELHNLLFLCNEIFGEKHHDATFVWKSRTKPTNAGKAKFRPQKVTEYILLYSRNSNLLFNTLTGEDNYSYPNEDEDGKYRTTTILTSNLGSYKRETMRFTIGGYTPSNGQRWKAGEDIIQNLYNSNRLQFNDGIPMQKVYEDDNEEINNPLYTLIKQELSGTAESGKTLLNKVVGMGHGFDTVKPIELLKYLFEVFTDKESIVLDSFAGSGTTGHAVLELNKKDNGNRKFIQVELDDNIMSEITIKRIKNVINGYTVHKQNGDNEKVEGLGGGFRYCKLSEPLFDRFGNIRQGVKFKELARHIFFSETGVPLSEKAKLNTPLIGTYKGVAYYLLFNGIMGDESIQGGSVLTSRRLETLPKHNGPKIIFGESNRLSASRLKKDDIVFKQIPYEIRRS
jgi:DNA modification methylase